MATKKQNKRHIARRVRRALNKTMNFFRNVSGRRAHMHGYGMGLASSDMKTRERDDG